MPQAYTREAGKARREYAKYKETVDVRLDEQDFSAFELWLESVGVPKAGSALSIGLTVGHEITIKPATAAGTVKVSIRAVYKDMKDGGTTYNIENEIVQQEALWVAAWLLDSTKNRLYDM